MTLGPIEVLVVSFPGNQFNGQIIPELEKLIESGTISVVDGLFISKDVDGTTTFVEFEQLDVNHDAARLGSVLEQIDSLISDEDVEALSDELAPNSSGAILVFEHTWAKDFRDAVVQSGGILSGDFRVPGIAVDILLDELAELSATE